MFQPLWQALYDAHADVVLSGHAHDYERFAPQTPAGAPDNVKGIRQFVVGTGGRNLQPLGAVQPNSEVRQSTTFGVLKLVLHAASYDWQFMPTAGGTFTDSGTRGCAGQDAKPPTAPTGLTATPTSSAGVDLSWGRSTDDVGVTGYRVYRNNAQVGSATGSQTAYADTTVAPATTYTYEVSALDAAGHESPRSNAVTVTTPDAPPGLTHVFAPTDDAYVEQGIPNTNLGTGDRVVVDANPTDNLLLRFDVDTSSCDITGARLRLTIGPSIGDGSPKAGAFATTVGSDWSESTVTWANAPPAATIVGALAAVDPGQTYEVNVSPAVIGDGPVSLRSATTSSSAVRYVSKEGSATLGPRLVVTCREDTQPPTAPAQLSATAASSSRVNLSWDASTDDVGVTGYKVFRNNVLVKTVGGTATSTADTGLAASTTYIYQVSAFDAAGHDSPRSSVGVTTLAKPPRVFAPTDDAYVDQSAPDTNSGASGSLVIDAGPAQNLLLRFDVATSGCHITSAKLRVTVGAGANDGTLKGGAFSSTVTTGWSASTVTWNNAPAANAAVIASLGAVNPGQTYEVDVSSAVTGDGPVSLRATTTSMGAGRYVSTEGSATLGPRLVVTCA